MALEVGDVGALSRRLVDMFELDTAVEAGVAGLSNAWSWSRSG